MNPAYNSSRTPRWLYIVVVALVILTVVRVGFAVYQRMSTGVVNITTSEPNAIVSISQVNKQAAYLGRGDVSARLKPGDYLVSATLAGDRTIETIHITSGQTVNKKLNPAHVAPPISSSTSTGFVNFDSLITVGMISKQILQVQDVLSEFKPEAKIVSIDAASVQPLPLDPKSIVSKVKFDFTIDKVPYHALITYIGPGAVQITVTDATGTQVYKNTADTGQ